MNPSPTTRPARARPAFLASAILVIAVVTGSASAAPLTYRVDPDHTYPSFEADHMGVSVWRGKLNKSSGTVVFDKASGSGSVDIAVDLASIDFGHDELNGWARSAEFFDVAKHPIASYQGRFEGVVKGVPTRLVGQLGLHGVSRPLTLRIHALKCVAHPLHKRELCGADASGSFQRDAFGLDMGKDYGFDMSVTLRIQIEAIALP